MCARCDVNIRCGNHEARDNVSTSHVAHAQEHVHSRVSPAPIVDGSQQPELIPDDFAIRALMETLQVAPNADEAALKQLRSRVRRVNLSEDDIEILVRELGMFDTHVKAQQLKALSFRPSPTANRVAIDLYAEEQAKLNALIVDHYEQLLSSLSSDGAAKLRNHLLHVKSRMKVYPRPDMAVSGN